MSRVVQRWSFSLCLVASLAGSPGGTASQGEAATDSLLITSVPLGLKVYLSQDTGTAPGAHWDQETEGKGVPLVDAHAALDERHFKGKTPLLLRNVAPGEYLLALVPVTILDAHHEKSAIDDTLMQRAFVAFEPLKPSSFKDGLKGAAVYSITKRPDTADSLLVLALASDASLDDMEAHYPSEDTFFIDPDVGAAKLRAAGLPEELIPRILALLRRGGKLVLNLGALRFVVNALPDQNLAIRHEIRRDNSRLANAEETVLQELDRLQGAWEMTALAGSTMPPEIIKALGFTIVIVQDTFAILTMQKRSAGGFITVNPSARPRTLDFTFDEGAKKGKKDLGIYKLVGDTLTLCTAQQGAFGPPLREDQRPGDFVKTEGFSVNLYTFDRIK